MSELIRQVKDNPQNLLLLIPLFLLVFCLISLLVSAQTVQEPEPSASAAPASTPSTPPPASPAVPAPLVTREMVERMSYTDSVLGELQWELSEESLEELNRVLRKYNIVEPKEILHFLAQATVESGAGQFLLEQADESYCRRRGYTLGTRGAGYLHLTHGYGQMAFATWMMKQNVPGLADIAYVSPSNHGADEVSAAYYAALQAAANQGLNVARYSRIVYDSGSALTTGAEYIAEAFAWESAGYYWTISGIGALLAGNSGAEQVDAVSDLIGGANFQSRREAYAAFYPILISP